MMANRLSADRRARGIAIALLERVALIAASMFAVERLVGRFPRALRGAAPASHRLATGMFARLAVDF